MDHFVVEFSVLVAALPGSSNGNSISRNMDIVLGLRYSGRGVVLTIRPLTEVEPRDRNDIRRRTMTHFQRRLVFFGIVLVYLYRFGARERRAVLQPHGVLHRAGGFHGAHVDRQRGWILQEAWPRRQTRLYRFRSLGDYRDTFGGSRCGDNWRICPDESHCRRGEESSHDWSKQEPHDWGDCWQERNRQRPGSQGKTTWHRPGRLQSGHVHASRPFPVSSGSAQRSSIHSAWQYRPGHTGSQSGNDRRPHHRHAPRPVCPEVGLQGDRRYCRHEDSRLLPRCSFRPAIQWSANKRS